MTDLQALVETAHTAGLAMAEASAAAESTYQAWLRNQVTSHAKDAARTAASDSVSAFGHAIGRLQVAVR